MSNACELKRRDGTECGNEDNLKSYLMWNNDVRIADRLLPARGNKIRWVNVCPDCALRVMELHTHGGILQPETDQRFAKYQPREIDDESHIIRSVN